MTKILYIITFQNYACNIIYRDMVIRVSYITHINLYNNFTHLRKYGFKHLPFYGLLSRAF